MTPSYNPLGQVKRGDPELYELIEREQERQRTTLQLIASENFTSVAVMEATGSVLTNKYSEGYPKKRYYGGNAVVDEIEQLAIDRLKELFGAGFGNVQPHAGANANAGAYLGLLEPGDTVLAMRLDQGGHLTHGSPVNFSGRLYNFVSYGLSENEDDLEMIDLGQIATLAKEHHPKLIVVGATAYPRIIDIDPIREIADEVGAYVMFDAAHVAGLIAGGVYPNPLVGSNGPGCDLMTFTTHKTLRGPRGAAIVTNSPEIATKVDKAIFPGLQGGPLENAIAAKAVAFKEALDPSFRVYARSVVENAKALADSLVAEGFRLVSGGTDTHLILCDLRNFDAELSGKEAQEVLDSAGITCNRNQIPFDPRSPFVTSGLRFGTPAMTTCGMGVSEMETVGSLIARSLRDRKDQGAIQAIRDEVGRLCSKFPPPLERRQEA